MKTILLTGATGYLGNRIGCSLLEKGYNIIALHLNQKESFGCDEKYANNVKKIYLSETTIDEIFENNKFDIIIHTATLYGRTNESISEMISANVVFPVELINLSLKYGVGVFINTDTILNKFINPYSLTKSHLTDWMNLFVDKIKMIDMKLDHFYGPNDKNTKFIAMILEKLKNNDLSIDLTEGLQTRDFIYIDDVIDAFMIVIKNIDKIGLGNVSVFEVGTNVKTSIRYLVEKLKALTNSTSILNFGAIPYRKNEVLDYDVNTTALRLLGWNPQTDIDDGLEKIVNEEK